jgi:enamine deaminase RidA (YjgF/YER057c/UK114 family)
MAKIVKLNSGSTFEEKASYSRAVAVDNWIYVSNTAGRNPETKEIPEDFSAQAFQVFSNLEAALASFGAVLADVIFSRVFVQNADDIPAMIEILGNKFKGIDPATTVTCPPLGSSVYKVEIEVTAYKGASTSNVETLHVSS